MNKPAPYTAMTEKSHPDGRFAIFSFLWAAAVIFHLGKWNIWLDSTVSFALGVSAVIVLLKPSSPYRLCVLILLQLADAFEKMPWIPNHWLFATIVNLTILTTALTLMISSGKINIEKSELFDTFAPAVRLEIILLYLLAFFHKLNTDWLDPGVSCGTKLYLLMTGASGLFRSSLFTEYFAIYGALAVELIIPVSLIIRRTRTLGIIIALFFHFILGTGEFYNFSAVMYALLFLFAPDNFSEQLRKWWNGTPFPGLYRHTLERGLIKKARLPVLIISGALCLGLFIYARLTYPSVEQYPELRELGTFGRTRLYYAFLGLWWIYGIFIIAIFLLVSRREKPVWDETRYFVPGYKLLALFPILVLINGISPYIGLKTQTSWSMFSNLRTEGGTSNHLLINHPYYLTDYQTDLVEIKNSSDPRLRTFKEKGYSIPYFELRRYMSEKHSTAGDGIGLEYVRKGSVKSVSDRNGDPGLFEPEKYILRKLLYFKPVPHGKKGVCQH
ncbi:MAG: HTTM domain-containing protein [Thermodesulfobacteriota bacterium]